MVAEYWNIQCPDNFEPFIIWTRMRVSYLQPCHTCCSWHRGDASRAKVDVGENLANCHPKLDEFAVTLTLGDFDPPEVENCAVSRQVILHLAIYGRMSPMLHCLLILSQCVKSHYRWLNLQKCPIQNFHNVLLQLVGVSSFLLSVRLLRFEWRFLWKFRRRCVWPERTETLG
jgi:hypothetical protein